MREPISNLNQIYWDLAIKYKLRKEQIEEIIESQFKYIRDRIKNTNIKDNNTIKGISITHIGKFIPKNKLIKKHLTNILKCEERIRNIDRHLQENTSENKEQNSNEGNID